MKIELKPGETLLREGLANLFRGIEAVGGKLFLTDRRLYFQSHAINVQAGATEIPLSDIRGARAEWTRFLGIPLAPNGLYVDTHSGHEYRFVVYRRRAWMSAIGEQISRMMA